MFGEEASPSRYLLFGTISDQQTRSLADRLVLLLTFLFFLGFLKNPKRFNVSVSRAQALLIVIGNPHVLSADPQWGSLLRFAQGYGCYVGPEVHTMQDVEQKLIAAFDKLDFHQEMKEDVGWTGQEKL